MVIGASGLASGTKLKEIALFYIVLHEVKPESWQITNASNYQIIVNMLHWEGL